MSFNNLLYDTTNYKMKLGESVTTLDYILSPFRYEHADKRRHNLGIVGGSAVSHIRGNLVDLESELRCQTRLNSRGGTNQYKPLILWCLCNPINPYSCIYGLFFKME